MSVKKSVPTSPNALISYLTQQGILDAQFVRLLELQSSTGNSSFVAELAQLFVAETCQRIQKIDDLMMATEANIGELNRLLNEFKGSCATFGAAKMTQCCSQFLERLQQRDADGCRKVVDQMKANLEVLKHYLDLYVAMVGNSAANGSEANNGANGSGGGVEGCLET